MVQKIKSKISGVFSKKEKLLVSRKERERMTRTLIQFANDHIQDETRKEASTKFLKAVGLGKPARNTSKT